ncbi:MAG TPA: DedA family protein [Mobilitalea sp.]|nr:DedA family protein [Mobilitalea sp.]
MQDWIIDIMNNFGYLGISLLVAIENIFPPIPSEIILTFGGFMTTTTNLSVFGVIVAATIGSVIGAIVLYGVGCLLPAERIAKILDGKLGKLLGFKKDDVYKAYDWFSKKGKISVLLCRCVPIVRSLISIPAGMAKMQFGMFLLLTTIGSLVWNTVLVNLGAIAGASWEKIVTGMDVYQTITIAVLGVIGLAILYLYIRFRKKNKTMDNQ